MTDAFSDVLSANCDYAAGYSDPNLEGRAARGLAVVTCMDSRIDPLAMLGLAKGDAKILRNAGARVTDDVLRTLVLAVHLLAVRRIMVVAHTDCRMSKVTEEQVHADILSGSGVDTRALDFGTISDQRAVLAHDVRRVRRFLYLPDDIAAIGCVYDVRTGALEVVIGEDDEV
ncbi:MAG: carbonic anhydrase [Actinobacteria bacterium]|nr:carbonic anhydrase [Actinomycetota bacterium]